MGRHTSRPPYGKNKIIFHFLGCLIDFEIPHFYHSVANASIASSAFIKSLM